MKKFIPIVITAVVAGGLGFVGGMQYVKSSVTGTPRGANFQNASTNGTGTRQINGLRQSWGFASGEILSKDETGITLKLADGGSKIVFVASSTKIMKSTEGSTADLVSGKQASINGTSNSDGSITAQSIQLRPEIPQRTQN
jgi:hypothetical protein